MSANQDYDPLMHFMHATLEDVARPATDLVHMSSGSPLSSAPDQLDDLALAAPLDPSAPDAAPSDAKPDFSHAALSKIDSPDDLLRLYGPRLRGADPAKVCAIMRTFLRVLRLRPPRERAPFHPFFRALALGIVAWPGAQTQDLVNTVRAANWLKYPHMAELQPSLEERVCQREVLNAWDVSELLESYAGLGQRPGEGVIRLLLHSMDRHHETFEPKARRVSLQSLEKLELYEHLPAAHEALTREPWRKDIREGKGAGKGGNRGGASPVGMPVGYPLLPSQALAPAAPRRSQPAHAPLVHANSYPQQAIPQQQARLSMGQALPDLSGALGVLGGMDLTGLDLAQLQGLGLLDPLSVAAAAAHVQGSVPYMGQHHQGMAHPMYTPQQSMAQAQPRPRRPMAPQSQPQPYQNQSQAHSQAYPRSAMDPSAGGYAQMLPQTAPSAYSQPAPSAYNGQGSPYGHASAPHGSQQGGMARLGQANPPVGPHVNYGTMLFGRQGGSTAAHGGASGAEAGLDPFLLAGLNIGMPQLGGSSAFSGLYQGGIGPNQMDPGNARGGYPHYMG